MANDGKNVESAAMYKIHCAARIFLCLFIYCNYVTTSVIAAKDFESTLGHLKARTSPELQERAVQKLIERHVGEKVKFFDIVVDPELGTSGKETFKVINENDVICYYRIYSSLE